MSKERQFFMPPGGPPRVGRPSQEVYAAMGEDNIFAMMAASFVSLVEV